MTNPFAAGTLKHEFFEKCKTSAKFIVSEPRGGSIPLVVEIEKTADFYVIYAHSKGNRWNLGGHHYYYFHDLSTGEFKPTGYFSDRKNHPKERILKADYDKFVKLYKEKTAKV